MTREELILFRDLFVKFEDYAYRILTCTETDNSLTARGLDIEEDSKTGEINFVYNADRYYSGCGTDNADCTYTIDEIVEYIERFKEEDLKDEVTNKKIAILEKKEQEFIGIIHEYYNTNIFSKSYKNTAVEDLKKVREKINILKNELYTKT